MKIGDIKVFMRRGRRYPARIVKLGPKRAMVRFKSKQTGGWSEQEFKIGDLVNATQGEAVRLVQLEREFKNG